MKKLIGLSVIQIYCVSALFCQTSIVVTESTFKLAGLSEESYYYGFSEGDQIIFDFQELNGKELKEIEISEWPNISKFMDYKTKSIANKSISVSKTGIYKFRFANSSLGGKICKILIKRIPANERTVKFNTNVYWKTIMDTTYTPVNEKFLIKSDTSFVECYNSLAQISSANALNGNKNYQVLDFYLPENTISWSYYIGTGEKGKQELENAKSNLMNTASSSLMKLPGYGPLAALALSGVSFFDKIQGEDNVKFWFITNASNVELFQNNQPFYSYKKGDVINEASQMKTPLSGKIYLGVMNDNTMDPISVTISVVAFCIKNTYEDRAVQKMNINSVQVPYLEN